MIELLRCDYGFCLFVGFCLWYLYYGLECWMNGATMSRNQYLMHFSCLWEEFLWALPFYGAYLKGEYIREQISDFEHGAMCSSSGSWDYSEIREKNLYKKVGKAMLPGTWHFVCTHIVFPLMPLFAYIGILTFIRETFG